MTDSRSFYGRWARPYDWFARAPVVRSWRREAVDSLDLSAGATAVDMGCGSGANLGYLAQVVGTDGTVIGVDLTKEMLVRARDRASRDGSQTTGLARGDATRPPVADVDAVLATFVVGIFEDPARVIERWCDCVHPGGTVALLHFRRSERWFATPTNLAYEAFVRLSAPGSRLSRSSLARDHDERIDRAHAALRDRTDAYRETRLAGGYVRLASGRVT